MFTWLCKMGRAWVWWQCTHDPEWDKGGGYLGSFIYNFNGSIPVPEPEKERLAKGNCLKIVAFNFRIQEEPSDLSYSRLKGFTS